MNNHHITTATTWQRKGQCPECKVSTFGRHKKDCGYRLKVLADRRIMEETK